MTRGTKTSNLQRLISLLLALVMTVSGTGLTAFASEIDADEPETVASEEEGTAEEEPVPEQTPEEGPAPSEPEEQPADSQGLRRSLRRSPLPQGRRNSPRSRMRP